MEASEREGIVTPEAVLLEFSEAGIGSRGVAFILDLLIRMAVALVALIGMFSFFRGQVTSAEVITYIILGFLLIVGYPVIFEVLTKGQTPGKMALGLRVVTVEGAPVRLTHSSIRAALGLGEFFMTLGAVAVFSSLLSRRSQRLGDLFAGTIVVRERAATRTAGAIAFSPPYGWEQFAHELDVKPITNDMYVLVRDFLLRVNDFKPEQRWRLSVSLADQVARRLQLPRTNTYPEPFLIAVTSAYQATHAQPATPQPTAAGRAPVYHHPEMPAVEPEDIPLTWGTT